MRLGYETLWFVTDIRTAATQYRDALGSISRGEVAWAAMPALGQPHKLTLQQCRWLLDLLLKGARTCGLPNELWTFSPKREYAGLCMCAFGWTTSRP
jgi:hypothetical protein